MEYVDTALQPLSEDIKRSFLELRKHLAEQDKSGNILLLYRGEKQRNISQRLVQGGQSIETPEVFERAFYFGDKARHCSVDIFDNDRSHLTGINDCSDETLTFIFERICSTLVDPRVSSPVNANTSREFREFFCQKNLDEFLSKLNESYTPETLLRARDYYLYFLHVAGAAGVRRETMFVSTSTDIRVAKGFSTFRNKNSCRIVFHYFIPQPFHIHAIAPWVADHHQRIVYALELPTFKPLGLFPRQREVSVKGALFPHFILGIELIDDQKFIINSNFDKMGNRSDFETLAMQGFKIDQSDFHNRIFDTGYIRWGETDLAGNFESNDV